jgi:hypothetical protein
MTTIVDALAKYGVRGAIKSLLSPQESTSDYTESSAPRYVCARKNYESGRKGRICVYRISDEHTDSDGRKARLYTNVEGVHIDEDERQSFTGIEHTRSYNSGRSLKQKKNRIPLESDEVRKGKADVKKPTIEADDSSDEGSEKCSKNNGITPFQARGSTSYEQSVVHRPAVNIQKRARRKSRSDPQRRVSVVERRRSSHGVHRHQKADHNGGLPSRAERHVRKERATHCSGAPSIPQHQSDHLRLGSALMEPSRQPRQSAIGSTIKLNIDASMQAAGVLEYDRDDGERNEYVVREARRSPFRQPGLTSQESSDLVFGTSSKVEPRRRLQVGRMNDRVAPDVHELASQLACGHPLGETGAQSNRFLSTATPSTPPYTPEKGDSIQK